MSRGPVGRGSPPRPGPCPPPTSRTHGPEHTPDNKGLERGRRTSKRQHDPKESERLDTGDCFAYGLALWKHDSAASAVGVSAHLGVGTVTGAVVGIVVVDVELTGGGTGDPDGISLGTVATLEVRPQPHLIIRHLQGRERDEGEVRRGAMCVQRQAWGREGGEDEWPQSQSGIWQMGCE